MANVHSADFMSCGQKSFIEDAMLLVSTCFTLDAGWETMVFRVKEGGDVDFSDLYAAHYDYDDEARAGHKEIAAKIESGNFKVLDNTDEDGFIWGEYLIFPI